MFSLNIEVLNTTSFIQKFMFSSTVYLLKGTSSVILKEPLLSSGIFNLPLYLYHIKHDRFNHTRCCCEFNMQLLKNKITPEAPLKLVE